MSASPKPLAFRAECELGLQLVIRNRPVRLVVLLVAMVVAMAVAGGVRGNLAAAGRLTFVAGGSLMAVAASRLLAKGAALAAARRAAAPACLHAAGRLTAITVVGGPLVAGMAALLAGSAAGWAPLARLILVGWTYAAAVAALALMLGPIIGASGAASAALVLVWLGGIPPSGMQGVFEAWPPVQRPVVWLWNLLPLGWRAHRLHVEGEMIDAILLGGWVVIGVAVAAWAAARAPVEPARGAL